MTEPSRGLADEINRLASAVRTSDAPPDVATQVRTLAVQARGLLEPHSWAGPYAVEQLAPPGDGTLTWLPGDLGATIPYSPILGHSNPTAGRARLWIEDDAVCGTVTTCPIHAGPIGTVHGGVVAALLDELANLAVLACGHVGYTKTLTVDYRRPTPLGVELQLWAHCAGRTGDVFLTTAEVRHQGRVTASAVGVHKAAGRRDEPVYSTV
jgi:acyl-coenzyme A thioesterase PaaI-like protein